MKESSKIRVMIAGIGGASLGTEICKSLILAGGYEVYGCDVSPTAYGLYQSDFKKAYFIDRSNYVSDVKKACHDCKASFLIPGGEQPMALLGTAADELIADGIHLLANAPDVISVYSDKDKAFQRLAQCGIAVPKTVVVHSEVDVESVGLPCIVKPATGSGGSVSVFFATTVKEVMIYADFIRGLGAAPIAQEYIDVEEGEFTVGVLSLPDSRIAGSVALRRALDAKLSVSYRGRGGLISSGYSQGFIGEYPEICLQAEKIATAIGSRGPINIQGRMRSGILVPFEINPRFSASTYLRAMAGFNEIDMLIRFFASGVVPSRPEIKSGWYLRSLTEQYVPHSQLKDGHHL